MTHAIIVISILGYHIKCDCELPGIIAESGFLQLMSEAGESRIISVSEKCQLVRCKKDNML